MVLNQKRAALSLVELMVVIAIFAVLASLLLVGIMGGWGSAGRLETFAEIVKLEKAVADFENHRNVRLPSRLKLARFAADSDQETRDFLCTMFKNPDFLKTWSTVGIIWNTGAGNGPVDLQGDQCLVFCLAGAQVNSWPIGFNYEAANPAVGGTKYFDFKAERLRSRSGPYLSYYDPWDKAPYAYLRSTAGGYQNDCNALGVRPYAGQRPNTFQIISAGPDGVFGDQGNAWTPVTGPSVYPPGYKGRDDQANFHGNRALGN